MKTTICAYHPDQIHIPPSRQRKEFSPDAHNDLKESILRHGLFHPPGIQLIDSVPTLVYGECRLRALKAIFEDTSQPILYNNKEWYLEVPCSRLPSDFTEEDLMEIELNENLLRKDLTWQEETAALASLKALRTSQTPDSPPTVESLALEAETSTRAVSESLALAEHLDDPDVAKAKTKKEARKIIERKAKENYAAQRAESYDPTASAHTLLEGDCREQIKSLPAQTFSCIVTDPPYGIDMHKDQSWDGTWHEYDDTEEYCFNLIHTLLPEWDRVTEEEAHLYIFCDFAKFEALRAIVEEHGVFSPMYFPFIWDKGNIASYPRPDHWPRKSYECILYAIKGEKKQRKLDLAVIQIPQVRDQDHPAGKPADLYAHLISRSCLPGDHVLDCFTGQGSIFKAAQSTSTVATGIELSPKYITLAKNTLKEVG